MSTKLGLKDITIVPAVVSNIEHRSDCSPYVNINYNPCSNNNMLPLIASPMAAVLNETNYKIFNENGIFTVIPRTIDLNTRINLVFDTFVAFGLNEVIDIFINRNDYFKKIMNAIEYEDKHRCYICIDIANGHMKKLLDVIKTIKDSYGDSVIVMAGNIANPETYKQYAIAGCDYVRAAIGTGSACTSSSNGAVHYPMASLLYDINKVKSNLIEYNNISKSNNITQLIKIPYIIADGGCTNFDDIIKCLALGADFVMSGKLFAQAFESAGTIECSYNSSTIDILHKNNKLISSDNVKNYLDSKLFDNFEIIKQYSAEPYNVKFYKVYYGMSTKRAQTEMGNESLKTAEGIEFKVPLLYTLHGWVDNFKHYLRSAMSYCNAKCLNDFKPKTIQISHQAFNAYYK